MSVVALDKAIYERMANDATLTSLITTYEGGPAIFTVDPIPTDAEFPFVVANEDIAFPNFDTKTKQGFDLTRNVKVFTLANGSRKLLGQIADRLQFLFHKQEDLIQVDGFKVIIANMRGPRITPTDERVYGVELELRLVIQEL